MLHACGARMEARGYSAYVERDRTDDTASRRVADRLGLLGPSARSACAQCPWRLENQGKRHRHGFYTKANLRRLWAGIRRGERMTCHPTDPAMAEFEGYEGTAERELTHECVGALVLAQREVMRFQWACEAAAREGARDGYARYRRMFPRGLLREGFAVIVSATMFVGRRSAMAAGGWRART